MDTMPKMRAPQPFLLPQWAQQVWSERSTPLPTLDGRMRFAIRLATMNVQHSGHPFGAAVFERESGALVAIGINLVMQTNCSLSHAEMVALACAQRHGTVALYGEDGDALFRPPGWRPLRQTASLAQIGIAGKIAQRH